MSAAKNSGIKIRELQLRPVRDLILDGCCMHKSFAEDSNMPRCGKDCVTLEYGNGGYGEPRWCGYCVDHLKEREL